MKRFVFNILILFLISSVYGIDYTPEALADEVRNLPGVNEELSFRQFSGFLDIPESTKKIHYWFTESENDVSNDPVVFWTNGGFTINFCEFLVNFLSIFLTRFFT